MSKATIFIMGGLAWMITFFFIVFLYTKFDEKYFFKDTTGNVGQAYECGVNDIGYMYCSNEAGTFAVDFFKKVK